MSKKPGTYANFKTSEGTIVCELFEKDAPVTVANFVGLAEGTKDWNSRSKKGPKLYDGTIFHRVIPQFMIQGGDPLSGDPRLAGTGGPGYQFNDEIHPDLTFDRPYLLAMANSGIRGGRGTNGSQFFITVVPTYWLNGKHTIFGEVISGKEVVDAIASTPTRPGDRPATDVVLESVTINR